MEKPRQTTLLQIFGSMSNKKSQPELVQQPSELKKE